MGTDIHTIAQYRFNQRWITCGHDIGDDDRNYDSFAVLANVRNGSGFAGVKTGEGWDPISDPRGLPEGTNERVECPTCYSEDAYWLGDHSHSWVTLTEMKTAWEKYKDKGYTVHGCLEKKQWIQLQGGTLPDTWSGHISGQSIILVNDIEARAGAEFTHVKTFWTVPAANRLHYIKKCIDALEGIKAEKRVSSDDDIRMVFGFDS